MTVIETPPHVSPVGTRVSLGPRAGTALWIVTAVAAVALIVQSAIAAGGSGTTATIAALCWQVLLTVFVFWHGGRRYGAGGIVLFFVVTYAISNAYENLSIATGFPFGHYHYTHDGTPFLFQVPATIGMAYFEYGYLAWCIAAVLLGRRDGRPGVLDTVLRPATAAFVMVMWDLVMDPLNSTIGHTWIWHDGGGYNGVPLTNYLGWYLTVWTCYQVFAIVLRARPGMTRPQPALGYWVMPVLLYGLTALSYILPYALGAHRAVTDPTGRAWTTNGIDEASVTVMVFTMLFATFLAAVGLVREGLARRADRVPVRS